MSRVWFTPFLLLISFACQEQNIALVNEIKTLDARWIRVSGQLTDLGKVIPKWTIQMEDSKSILQEMGFSSVQIRDSIVNEQTQMVIQIKKVSGEFEKTKIQFEDKINAFNLWQHNALKISGENPDQIKEELRQFQEEFEKIRVELEDLRIRLYALAQNHNDLRISLLEENEWVQYDPISIR
jgi:hypothetical protein